MRVLGLDPGLRHPGRWVVDIAANGLSHVADGVVHAPIDGSLAERLVSLFQAARWTYSGASVRMRPRSRRLS